MLGPFPCKSTKPRPSECDPSANAGPGWPLSSVAHLDQNKLNAQMTDQSGVPHRNSFCECQRVGSQWCWPSHAAVDFHSSALEVSRYGQSKMPSGAVANQLPSRGPGTNSLSAWPPKPTGLDCMQEEAPTQDQDSLCLRQEDNIPLPIRQLAGATSNTTSIFHSVTEGQGCRHDIATAMRCFSTFH